MFAAASSSPNVSQLLDLHRESLARFDEVTLVQTLVNGRKVLTLTIGVPVDERRMVASRRVKSSRKKEKEMERLRAWREKKRQERVMASSPTPPPVSPPQSPLPRDIPQLDGDASISNDGRDAEDRSDARDRNDHDVDGNDDAVDRRDNAVDRRDDAGDHSNYAVDRRDDAGDRSRSDHAVDRSDPRDRSYDARDPSNTGTLLPTTGAMLRTEGTASEKLVTVAGPSPQHLNRPRPRKVYNPAGRKHIPQNPLYQTPTYK